MYALFKFTFLVRIIIHNIDETVRIILKIPTYFKLLAKIYRYNGSSKRNSILRIPREF